MAPHTSEAPAKKQSKWSADEDAIIIELRGSGMKWEDISKQLPGRSAISCRLHYQNYLERRSEWDEERKNKLARLYERFKPEMWAKVAEEMQVPWRAAEAMHWQIGEREMATRAGVLPFTLSSGHDAPVSGPSHRVSPSRGHAHQHSQSSGSSAREMGGTPSPRYGRGQGPGLGSIPPPMIGGGGTRTLAARREGPPGSEALGRGEMYYGGPGVGPPGPGLGLAPIQTGLPSRSGGMLPGVAELTTGVSPYSTPAYSAGMPSASPVASQTASPGPFLPGIQGYGPAMEPASAGKRRASPDYGSRETRRRHLDPRYDDGGGGSGGGGDGMRR